MRKRAVILQEKPLIHDNEYYYTLIRVNLRKIRIHLGYTQQNVADMTGSSRQYICDLENLKRCKHITIDLLGRIADALEVDIRDFFRGCNGKK